MIVNALEQWVLGGDRSIDLSSRLETSVHHRRGKGLELNACRDEPANGPGIELVVLRDGNRVGLVRGRRHQSLVLGAQHIPLGLVDEEEDRRRAFPPARIIVVGRDLAEAELLVVIGADPFGRIDGAAFERRIDVARRDLLRHDTQLG